MMSEFSIFLNGITKTIPDGKTTIPDVVDKIQQPFYKDLVEKIRKITDSNPTELKKKRNQIKKHLVYITPAGVFSKRNNKGIEEMSGYAPIDVDNISDIETIRNRLLSDPYIHLMYISPSGEGLKIIIKIPKNIHEYKHRVLTFYNYLYETYGISIDSLDKSTHDISRACFLSYDPDVYYNEKSDIFDLINENLEFNKKKDTSRSAIEYKELIKLLFCCRSKDYIYNYMEKFSKWNLASEQYKEYSYEKAKNYVDETTKLSAEEKKSIIPELARITQENNSIVTIQTDKCTEIWIYRDGIYVPNGRTYIEIYLGNILGDFYDIAIVQKIIDIIKKDTYMLDSEFFREEDPRYVCVQNGILDIFDKKLYQFSEKLRFFNKLPVKYDPDATCPNTLQHYKTVLAEDDIPLMQEIYGFLLHRTYSIQKAFLFSGDGGNGKGKSISQMKAFLGIDNVCNISLQALEEDSFLKSNLHKKLANLGSDLGKTELKDTSTFRELTGEDLITARRKFLEPISFENYAKMIFAVNKLPYISDDTDAFWRRWVYIDFGISFLPYNDYKKREEEGTLKPYHRIVDIEIGNKLNSDEELSGVLNWALDGLHRIMENKDFSYNKSYLQTKQKMQSKESSALMFSYNNIKKISDPDQYETHEELYKNYLHFCFNNELEPEPDLKFRKILQSHGYSLIRKRTATGWELRWYFIKIIKFEEMN